MAFNSKLGLIRFRNLVRKATKRVDYSGRSDEVEIVHRIGEAVLASGGAVATMPLAAPKNSS